MGLGPHPALKKAARESIQDDHESEKLRYRTTMGWNFSSEAI